MFKITDTIGKGFKYLFSNIFFHHMKVIMFLVNNYVINLTKSSILTLREANKKHKKRINNF